MTTLCTNLGHITSLGKGLDFNSDVWNPQSTGSQCIYVSQDLTKFNATWNWPNDGRSVHSYPHVSFKSSLLPIAIGNITNMTIASSWTMSSSPDFMANVALDMFADKNTTAAQSEQEAAYEIMIWLATFGGATPLGFSNGTVCCTQTLDGVTLFVNQYLFYGQTYMKNSLLYRGTNVRGHTTYSWLAQSNVSNFNTDFSPLLHTLSNNNLVPANANLGLIEFGSETFHSTKNITFSMFNSTLDIQGDGKSSHSSSPRLSICWRLLWLWAVVTILFS